MPLLNFYHPADAFTADDKKALAESLTAIYARFMPKFYVNVVFQPYDAESFYIGGEARSNFIRIWIDHIARDFPNEEASTRFINAVNQVIAPWVKDRGFDWEFHVDETPFSMWSIQGYFPPKEGTEDEARWIAENKASPRTHA
jgi:phenylpyruvate tautomerase PptA (4-oxalocrotonate tautomerase family)